MTRWLWAPVILWLVSVWMHAPLFSRLDPPFRDSIEAGYQSMARFVAQHPNPWGWNPTQYGGMPTQFMYLPVMPYTAAALSWLTGIDAAYAHRLVAATLATLAPVTLFALVWYFLRSPRWAAVTGFAYLIYSPLYGLVEAVDKDRGLIYLPWRLQVLAKYGEGPHNAALALLPLAVIALWRCAIRRDVGSLVLAAIAMALVVLTNWVGALALAMSCGLLLLAVWGKAQEHQFSFRRAFGAAGLAYLLACFWLTPSFIRTIAFNWPKDAYDYKVDDRTLPLFAGWLAGVLVIRLLFLGRREVYLCWSTMALWAFGYLTVIYYSWSHDVLPESRRYALEFELMIFVAVGAWLWRGWQSKNSVHRFCAIAPMALMLLQGVKQGAQAFTQPAAQWQLAPREASTEYRIAKWLAEQKPRGRVFATGGLRFRLNSYFDVPQAGGTFESGLRNRVPLGFAYHVRTGLGSIPAEDARDSVRDLQALGVEYAVVHGVKSAEYYRDFKNPAKFDGVLERAAEFGPDVIYRVPFRSLATVVRREELPAAGDWRSIAAYGAALSDAGRPAPVVTWEGPARVKVEGVPAGGLVSLAVNADEGWQVTPATVKIEENKLGWITLSGNAVLERVSTTEQRAFGALSGFAWLASLYGWWRSRNTGK